KNLSHRASRNVASAWLIPRHSGTAHLDRRRVAQPPPAFPYWLLRSPDFLIFLLFPEEGPASDEPTNRPHPAVAGSRSGRSSGLSPSFSNRTATALPRAARVRNRGTIW